MRTLQLLRHAKSGSKGAGVADHDRSLTARGERDAPRVGRLLRRTGRSPDLILSSTAKRARLTARAVGDELSDGGRLELDRRLYLADPEAILDVVRERGSAASRIMVVAHNPGLEELVARLVPEEAPEPLPTTGFVELALELEAWADLRFSTPARLVKRWQPRPRKAG